MLSPSFGFYYIERALAYYCLGNFQAALRNFGTGAELGEQKAQEFIKKYTQPYQATVIAQIGIDLSVKSDIACKWSMSL